MPQTAMQPVLPKGALVRRRIVVRGAVQGVGFRPFVYREAVAWKLAGWVANSAEGVIIEVEGCSMAIDALIETVRRSPPANSRVSSVTVREISPCGEANFMIRPSALGGLRSVQILPDLATCEVCLSELRDPTDRRYRYPFINCTQCGPRYSIVEALPYDRARTSMRHFTMCPACQAEYEDPLNRRFHAEPNACPVCGPHLSLWEPSGTVLARGGAALHLAADAIHNGKIVAVKGIGGFHLFADARDEGIVCELRDRKRREEKPFAVMFPTLAGVRAACHVNPAEELLLTAPARPIVLLRRVADQIARSVAPDTPRIGALIPYAPLHHLLLGDLGIPLVATSANASGEPIVTDDMEALERLSGIADLFLVHDRPIIRAIDDSVAQVVCGCPQLLRRSRGYAPAAFAADDLPEGLVAYGGHLKTTVALTVGGTVALGQHLGDLDTLKAREVHASAMDDILRLHNTRGRVAVCDAHPDYASTRAAETSGLPVRRVQHHVAHVAACMAEYGLAPPLLGVAWDGAGYGPNGTVWGGEFILLTAAGWRRVAHLRPFILPGGESAVREPRRAALGLLFAAYGDDAFAMKDLAPVTAFSATEREVLHVMLRRRINTPVTTSVGRLFDAFAALCGLRQRSSYEGQAAAALEWAADGFNSGRAYDLPLIEDDDEPLVVDWEPALAAAIAALRDGTPPAIISEALHNGLAVATAAVATRIGEPRIALTGGCFQNRRLTETVVAELARVGLTPYWHRSVPPNDGGLAVGQALWAAWHEREEHELCA